MSDNPRPRYVQAAGLDLINGRAALGYRVIQACLYEGEWITLMALEEADADEPIEEPAAPETIEEHHQNCWTCAHDEPAEKHHVCNGCHPDKIKWQCQSGLYDDSQLMPPRVTVTPCPAWKPKP